MCVYSSLFFRTSVFPVLSFYGLISFHALSISLTRSVISFLPLYLSLPTSLPLSLSLSLCLPTSLSAYLSLFLPTSLSLYLSLYLSLSLSIYLSIGTPLHLFYHYEFFLLLCNRCVQGNLLIFLSL